MAEKQDKYVVLKLQDLEELCELDTDVAKELENVCRKYNAYRALNGKLSAKYIVCNQDEPYADDVWNAILNGEDKK